MIDVEVLRAAGLTHSQIAAVFEAAAPLIAALDELRERLAEIREQNRKRKQNQRSGHVTYKKPYKKPNEINDRVRLTNGKHEQNQRSGHVTFKKPNEINGGGDFSSFFFFLDSERKKESRKCQADIKNSSKINDRVTGQNKNSSKINDHVTRTLTTFGQFWTAYPRKVGKIAAEKAFAKALQKTTAAEILAALHKQKPNLPADPQFIPHPATWLNQGRWLDEPDVARPLKFDARII